MRVRCVRPGCGRDMRVALMRGVRIADCRCPCGGEVKSLRAGACIPANLGKKMGACPVCGRRRLEGRPCWYHTKAEVEAANTCGTVLATETCQACHGYGYFDEDGNATIDRRGRKCLDCTGTGIRH